MTTATNRRRMTVRVVGNVLVADLVSAPALKTKEWGSWERVNQHELISKEFNHNAGLRRAVIKFKKEDMGMVDENTVVIRPANKQTEKIHTMIVYSVIRYGSQCPECGALPSKPNEWCELCMAQAALRVEGSFDPGKALDALLSTTVEVESEEDDD